MYCPQVRNTLKYVDDKNKKEFAVDLKTIYHAPSEEIGQKHMEEVSKKLGKGLYGELSIMYEERLE